MGRIDHTAIDLVGAYRLLADNPALARVDVRGSTVEQLMDRIAIFTHEGGGVMAPANAPAAAMRDTVEGARVLDRFSMLARHDGDGHRFAPDLQHVGFVLGSGAGAQEAAALLRGLGDLADDVRSLPAASRDRMLAQVVSTDATDVARRGQWIEYRIDPYTEASKSDQALLIGPDMRRQFEVQPGQEALTNRPAIETALHERHHLVSPTDWSVLDAQDQQLLPLEEGISELLARWPGQVEVWADRLQMPVTGLGSPLDPNVPYDRYALVTRGLTRLSGIDPDDPAAFADARALLQGVDTEQVPRSVAAAIVAERRPTPMDAATIEERIRGLRGDPDALLRLESDLGPRA